MKNRMKVSFLLVAVFICGILTQTFAATAIQQIKATLRTDVKYMVNGKKVDVKDSKGKTAYPIVYNGTTYIPANEALNALKIPFEYDTKTQTMYLGSKTAGPIRLTDLNAKQGSGAFPINKTVDKNILTIEEGDVIQEKTTYKFGLYADNITDYYNKVTYSLDKKYHSLKFKAYCINANERDVEVIVRDVETDTILYQKKFTTGQSEDVEADVTGVKSLQIQIRTGDYMSKGHKMLLIEPYLQ